MAHLKIGNPSKGAVSAACLKQPLSNTMGLTIKACFRVFRLLQKGSQFEQTPQSLDLLKVPCKKDLTSPMLKNSPKLLCSRFLTYDAWVYCPSSWCKLGRRTLVSAVAKTWPPNRWPEPLNKVTRWTIWCHASHGKSPQAVRNRKAPSWGHLAMAQKWFTP